MLAMRTGLPGVRVRPGSHRMRDRSSHDLLTVETRLPAQRLDAGWAKGDGHRAVPSVVADPLDEQPEAPGLLPRGQRRPDRVEDLQGPGQVAFIHGFPLESGSLFPESGQPLFPRFGHRGRHGLLVHPDAADVLHHRGFDLMGVEGPARTRRPAPLPGIPADVITVAFSVPAGTGVRHARPARCAGQQPLEQRFVFVAHLPASGAGVRAERVLDPLPQIGLDKGVVFPLIEGALVPDLPRIDDVGQQPVQAVLREGLAASLDAFPGRPAFREPSPAVDLPDDRDQGLVVQVEVMDRPDPRRFLRVDDVQGEPPHRAGRVELLRDRDEAHSVPVEPLHDAGEVQQRPAEPVHLVDHHAVDLAGLDAGQEPFECGPLHVPAGEAAVVVASGKADPALLLPAGDAGLGRFPLGVQAVEGLLESLIGGLARVDGAAKGSGSIGGRCRDGSAHALPFPDPRLWFRLFPQVSPKKAKPFHWLPVTCRAMAERDR